MGSEPPINTTRTISHDEATESARRLINSHFRQEPYARASIPARPDYDDDLIICAYIKQQAELARLRTGASALIDEIETVLRKFASAPQPPRPIGDA